MGICASLKFVLSITLCLFRSFLLTAGMRSKGSSYTLNCSVPGRGISGLLRGWLFPFSTCFNGAFFVVRFVLGAPVQETSFGFSPEVSSNSVQWCNWKGEKPRVAGPNPSPYMVSKGIAHATPQDVIFRDPSSFVAGELNWHQSFWNFILSEHPKKDEIFSYIARGVNISDFFVPFKGDFQGKFYNSATPPMAFFPNSKSCLDFE